MLYLIVGTFVLLLMAAFIASIGIIGDVFQKRSERPGDRTRREEFDKEMDEWFESYCDFELFNSIWRKLFGTNPNWRFFVGLAYFYLAVGFLIMSYTFGYLILG